MRILYYSPHPNLNLSDPAGYGTHIREMIASFRELGHEVLPLIMGGTVPRDNQNAPQNSRIKNIAKKLIPTRRWEAMKDKRLLRFDQKAQYQLALSISQFKPDFIYERANYMQVSGVRAANEAGVVHFLEMNSPYTEEKKELDGDSMLLPRADDLEKEQLKRSQEVICVSSSLRDYFLNKHRVAPGKFSILPNAISPEKLLVEEDTVADLRRKYGIEDKVVIGWVGSIQPWHGISTMIEAFAQLPLAQREQAALMIVGGGESLEEMKALAGSGPAAEQIVFTGYVPHVKVFAHIAAMDLCLLPNTKWYCSPIKIFEYGAMGKAIIASNHAAVLDVMEPDLDGLIIEPTPEALSQALRKIIPKPLLRERLASHFKEKVLRDHTWRANAEKVIALAEKHLAAAAQQSSSAINLEANSPSDQTPNQNASTASPTSPE